MRTPIIESVRDYIMSYPELKDGCLMVDILGAEPIEYMVEAVPCDPVYTRYVDGGCIRQFLFIFASREYFGADVNQAIENLAFYEQFSDWITANNDSGVLPELGDGRVPVSLEVTTCGYSFAADADTARYQIQLRLLYEED